MVQPSKRFPDAPPEPKAQRAVRLKRIDAESNMLDAVGVYLESKGWNCVVASADRIQARGNEASFEFVVKFTGSKKVT